MNTHALYLLLLLGICLQSCKQEPKSTATPEQVARAWQAHVDNNQFDEARKLSTKRAKDMIDLIESLLFGSEDDVELAETKFLEMKCKESENKASCRYIINEASERIVDSFTLVKQQNKWLVDIPEDADLLEDDPVDEMFNEYENSLNQALKQE